MKERENAQTIYGAKRMEKKRKMVMKCIAAWFHEAGIPSSTVCLESFDSMLEAIGQFGPGLRAPSPDELDGPLLQKQVSAINDSIEVLKKSSALEGCSLLVNQAFGDNGSTVLNLAVRCSQSVSFLHSIRVPFDRDYDSYIFEQVDSCIQEIGENSVVQVITEINPEMKSAKMLTEKRPNIFWTNCAADSINSMFEDLGSTPLVRKTISKARLLTAFIYSRAHLLDMVRQFTSQWDLVHVGITDYITCFLNLKSLYDKRIELKALFISKEWEDSKWSNGAVGKKFYKLVVSNEFWHGVLYTINSFEPLVTVLRRMGDGVELSMGYIKKYGEIANAKREIALRFEDKEEHYLPVWEEIDFRLKEALMTPLHLAGYYLNPFFYYQNKDNIKHAEMFRDAIVRCVHKMYRNQPTQQKIVHQLDLYSNAAQSFGTADAISTQMTADPVSWWELHGGAAKELRTMAQRLLRLTCGSLAYEESWIEKLHKEKPCWIKRKQFKGSMFVAMNRRIQGKAQLKKRDPVLGYVPCEDEPFEWLVGMCRSDALLDENHAFRMARVNSSEEVGLSKHAKQLLDYDECMSSDEVYGDGDSDEPPVHHSNNKASSGASCTKRAKKRPRCEGSDGDISYKALVMMYVLLTCFLIRKLSGWSRLLMTLDFCSRCAAG